MTTLVWLRSELARKQDHLFLREVVCVALVLQYCYLSSNVPSTVKHIVAHSGSVTYTTREIKSILNKALENVGASAPFLTVEGPLLNGAGRFSNV